MKVGGVAFGQRLDRHRLLIPLLIDQRVELGRKVEMLIGQGVDQFVDDDRLRQRPESLVPRNDHLEGVVVVIATDCLGVEIGVGLEQVHRSVQQAQQFEQTLGDEGLLGIEVLLQLQPNPIGQLIGRHDLDQGFHYKVETADILSRRHQQRQFLFGVGDRWRLVTARRDYEYSGEEDRHEPAHRQSLGKSRTPAAAIARSLSDHFGDSTKDLAADVTKSTVSTRNHRRNTCRARSR